MSQSRSIAQDDAETRKQREWELLQQDKDVVAWVAVVPDWTFGLAAKMDLFLVDSPMKSPRERLRESYEGASLSDLLDLLLQSGWMTNRPVFVPGECEIFCTPSGSQWERFSDPHVIVNAAGLKEIGLLADSGPLVTGGSQPSHHKGARFMFPTGQLRFRSPGIAFRSLEPTLPGDSVRATLLSFNREQPELQIEGRIFTCTGDEWSGYESVLILDQRAEFSRALYQRFSVSSTRRAELIRRLPEVRWRETCEGVARAIAAAHVFSGEPLAPVTARWAKLACRLDRGNSYVGRRIVRRVEALLRRGFVGEAINWLDAAAHLASVLAGEIESAVRLGQRRLELHYRKGVDERRLKYFYERREQLEPFEQLIRQESPHWALHYLGLGGVGKTMLLRFLNRRLLQQKCSVTRVDFDYLDADYPVRSPAQLLLEIGDSLQMHITQRGSEDLFRTFRDRADLIHRELQAAPLPTDALGNLHLPEFERVLTAFTDFVASLPQPVVLFLDTCEELARLQPDGRFQPGVQATFEILERIQQYLAEVGAGRADEERPCLRVVFAGRRLLAVGGADWQARGASQKERQQQFAEESANSPGRKPYLRLQEIRGFVEEEARDYLRRRFSQSFEDAKASERATVGEIAVTRLPSQSEEDLVSAILARSRDDTTASDFEWLNGHRRNLDARFNPFDVSLYADWIAEERANGRNLSAQAIRGGGSDPYIEIRIIQRLKHAEVVAALPALLLLRRIDKQGLADLFRLNGEPLENLYRELCQIEWMEYQPREDESGAWLEVDRHLRPRLEKYFEHPDRAPLLADMRSRLVGWIRSRLKALPEAAKPDEVLLSAVLRLLPSAEAASYWAELERRIVTQGDWHWAIRICENLLAEEGAVGKHITAAITATYAAAMLHTPDQTGKADQLELWETVQHLAHLNPIPAQALRLADRAKAARLGELTRRGAPQDKGLYMRLMRGFGKVIRERPSPNWGAAIEALVNLPDEDFFRLSPAMPFREEIANWGKTDGFSIRTAAMADALCLRLAASGFHNFSLLPLWHRLRKAAELPPDEELPNTRIEMPDWPLPLRLTERLRLEIIDLESLFDSAMFAPVDKHIPAPVEAVVSASERPIWKNKPLLRQWLEEAGQRIDQPDGIWLAARILEADIFTNEVEDIAVLNLMTTKVGDLPYVAPATPAQRRTPALFIALANAWSRAENPKKALRILDVWLNSGKLDSMQVQAARRSKAAVIKKYRLLHEARAFLNSLRHANLQPEDATILALSELVGGTRTKAGRPGTWTGVRRVIGKIASAILSVAIFLVVLIVCIVVLVGSGILVGGKEGPWVIAYALGFIVFVVLGTLCAIARGVAVAFAIRVFQAIIIIYGSLGVIGVCFAGAMSEGGIKILYAFFASLFGLTVLIQCRWLAVLSAIRTLDAAVVLNFDQMTLSPSANTKIELSQKRAPRKYWGRLKTSLRMMFGFAPRFFRSSRYLVTAARTVWLQESFSAVSNWSSTDLRGPGQPMKHAGDPVLAQLLDVQKREGKGRLVAALAAQPSVAGQNWEDSLSRFLEEQAASKFVPFRVLPLLLDDRNKAVWQKDYRVVSGLRPRMIMGRQWEKRFDSAWHLYRYGLWRFLWETNLWSGWQQLFHVARLKIESSSVKAGEKNVPAPAFRVCHLIGEAVETSSGINFRAGDGNHDGEEGLLSAEQLLREECGFFIVQEAPGDLKSRSQTDRERTAALRLFANELFHGGALAVLLIPPLPDSLVDTLVASLRSMLRAHRPPSLEKVLATTDNLRQLISEANVSGSEVPRSALRNLAQNDLSELAWEITLFARSREHGSLIETTATNTTAAPLPGSAATAA